MNAKVKGQKPLNAIFGRVFVGLEEEGERKREPGSWWARPKPLFGRDRGRSLILPPFQPAEEEIGPLDAIPEKVVVRYVEAERGSKKRNGAQASKIVSWFYWSTMGY